MRRVAEDASEPVLLAGVAEPDGTLPLVLGGSPPDRLRAADRNDLDPTQVRPSRRATASSAMRSVTPSTRTTAMRPKLA